MVHDMQGLKEMKGSGASTIAQHEASCIVYGMPKEAIALDAVDRVVSLEGIPETILAFAQEQKEERTIHRKKLKVGDRS